MKAIEQFLNLTIGVATMQLILRNGVLFSQLVWASADHTEMLRDVATGTPLRRARWRQRRRHARRRLQLLGYAAWFARRDRRQARTALVLALLKWPRAIGAPA